MARFVRRLFLASMAAAIALPILPVAAGLATTARADCAIGSECFQIEPSSGPPGATFHVTATTIADCHDLADPLPKLDFYRGGLGVGYGAQARLDPVAEGTWRGTVPKQLTDGIWKLVTYCVEDVVIRTVPTDVVFTVTGAPDTSTDLAEERPSPSLGLISLAIALASGALAFLWAMRPRSPRRAED